MPSGLPLAFSLGSGTIWTVLGASYGAFRNFARSLPGPRASPRSSPSVAPNGKVHDVRPTHGTLLIKAGVPVRVVSERLGRGNPAFTIDTYQHVLPGMQGRSRPRLPEANRTRRTYRRRSVEDPVEEPRGR